MTATRSTTSTFPTRHARLTLTADALVECVKPRPLPHRLGPGGWAQLDELALSGEFWEMLAPSTFVGTTPLLEVFAQEHRFERGNDPLVVLRRLMTAIYTHFEYSPRSTRVDSPIDEALAARRGVCQDFAHIFIALARELGIPARYVSGYLFRGDDSQDRSAPDATHAWAEAFLPQLGWVGFDPTNNLIAGGTAHPRGHRARLRRRAADARRLQRREQRANRAGRRCTGRAGQAGPRRRGPPVHAVDVARRRRSVERPRWCSAAAAAAAAATAQHAKQRQ